MQVTHKNGLEANEANWMSQMWFKYFPYWPLFLLMLLLSTGAAWMYLRYATPMYGASASILIKDEKKGADESKVIESLNQLTTKKIVENEIDVIQSRTLMDQVVRNLHLYAPIYEKGKIRSKLAYKVSPIVIEVQDPTALTRTNKVDLKVDAANASVVFAGASYPLGTWVTTKYGTLRFLPTRVNTDTATKAALYCVLMNPKEVAADLLKKLKAESSSKTSTVVNLSIKDESPVRAEDILNELIKTYNKANITDKNTLADNTLSFVEDRLGHVSHELDSIERKIQQYKSNQGAIDISTQGNLFLQNVSANDQKLGDVNVQLAMLSQVEKYVNEKDNSSGIVPSTLGVNDPILSQLLTKLYDAELEYERLKKTTAENNPMLVSLSDQIGKIKPSIIENIQNQRKSLEASRNNINAANSAYSSILRTLPQKERDLVEISREQSIKNSIYTFLLQKREEAALSYGSTVGDIRVVDRAASSLSPVSPNKYIIYLISIVLALVISVGLVYGKELFNKTILFRQEVEEYTTLPIISEIAYEKSAEPLVIGVGKRTFIAEQFRKLRTSLSYLGINADKKKILITSTISGEGKSFIAANLGLSLALAGKKVILLELDLSNPALAKKLNVYSEVGISNYLRGEATVDQIIKRTEANENLFIAPSGPVPENPSELIMNGKVQNLLAYLHGAFDYIILDTAPVHPMTDAYILSAFCDATLYVVRHKYTPKIFVQRLDENNKINQLENAAIVFNGVQQRGFFKDNYGYGYGYGYMYKDKVDKEKKRLPSNKL